MKKKLALEEIQLFYYLNGMLEVVYKDFIFPYRVASLQIKGR